MRTVLQRLPLILIALPIHAQTTAALRVRVLDAAGKPAAHAAVTLTALERGEQRRMVTDTRGEAFAAGLLPGAYRIQGQVIRLRADERAELTVRSGDATATVVVEASPLRTETSSVGVQTSFRSEDLERLPLAPQRYVEHAALVPGVTPSGKPEPVVLGSMLDGNAFLVDGMPTNLSSSGRFGMNLSSEILESQTLTTGGHKAEVGFAPGGVYGLVTRSGSDRFEGALFGSRIWRGLNSRPHRGEINQPDERPTDAVEWGLSLGGPVVKDRLYFFGAFNRQLTSLDFENMAPFGAPPHRRSLEEDRSYRFFKLTWLATDTQRVELAWFGDPVTQRGFDGVSDSRVKDDQIGDRDRGGNSFLLKHVAVVGASAAWESTLGLHRTTFHWYPGAPGAGPSRAQLDAPGKESFGTYPTERKERIENLSLRSEVTLHAGAHQLKGGFQGLRSGFTLAYKRPSLGVAYVDRAAGGPGPTAGDLDQIRAGLLALHGTDFGYGAADSLATPSPVSGLLLGGRASFLYQRTRSALEAYGDPLRQILGGLYLQDDWRIGERLTLNLGLRLDRAKVEGEDGRTLVSQTLLSPRLGAALDPGADGRTRFFIYAGRIYSPATPGALAAGGATTGGPAQTREVWIPTLQDWRAFQSTGLQGVKNLAIGKLRAPETWLYQAGLERMIPLPWVGTWVAEAVATWKRTTDLVDTYNPAYGYLPHLDALANASAGRKVIANLPGLRRTFGGFDLTLHRRFEGGHRIQFSYSYGDLQGNTEVGAVAAASGKDTGFAAIPSLREDYRQDRYWGPLNEQVRHAVKAFGSLALPARFELAWAFQMRSGLRYSRLVAVGGENVLAPGATRGDQQLPRVATLDLALSRQVKLGPVTWRWALDLMNATNQQPLVTVSNVGPAVAAGNHLQPRVWQFSARASF